MGFNPDPTKQAQDTKLSPRSIKANHSLTFFNRTSFV